MSMSDFTKINAINQIVAMNGTAPASNYSATGSSGSWPNILYGTSEYGQAERVLDDSLRAVQMTAPNDNVLPGQRFTTTGTPPNNEINLSSNVLRIEAVGRTSHIALWAIRNNKVVNRLTNSTILPPDTYEFNLVIAQSFEDSSPEIRIMATREAIKQWALLKENPLPKVQSAQIDSDVSKIAMHRPIVPPINAKNPPIIAQGQGGERQ